MRRLTCLHVLLFITVIIISCSTENTPVYQLTGTAEPTEAGSVTPASAEAEEGESIEITATANEHWEFDRWSGDYTGVENPTVVTMDSDKNVTAIFNRLYPLTVKIEGEGAVEENVVQQKTTDYTEGTVIELNANPDAGWQFVEWSGDINSTNNPETVLMDGETNVTAIFTEVQYTISTTIDGEGEITIIPFRDKYSYGEEVTLKAEPSEEWNFVHWDGDVEGTDSEKTIIIESDIDVLAVLDNSPFAGGNGTEMYPYQVSDIDQLQSIRDYTDKHFVQLNDIDASDTQIWNDGKGFNPIGDDMIGFSGSYDGMKYAIDNLNIDRGDERYVGLFGYLNLGSKIVNVAINNAEIVGGAYVGSLAGRNYGEIGSTYVTGSISMGSFSGDIFFGGLVGSNMGAIYYSWADVKVDGDSRTGGLAGESYNNSKIHGSYAIGDVTGSWMVGGLVGWIWTNGPIYDSFATGKVTGNARVGGLVGFVRGGEISNSYAIGDVTGKYEVGGLVGTVTESVRIDNSYSVGIVEGDEDFGGFVGINGNNGGMIEGNYWDTESSRMNEGSGRGPDSGYTPLETKQMTGATAVEYMMEFDWKNKWVTTDSYPILQWQED